MRTTKGLFVTVSILSALAAACGGGAAGPGAANASTTAGGDPSLPKPATKPESDKVTWKKDASPKSCHTGGKTGDAASVTAMTNACVDKKMHLVGQTNMGEGSRDKMVTTLPLKAEANHCYRVVGVADASVTDFDIAVMDSAGKLIGEDLLDSNDAVVLEDGVFCFKADDAVSVNVACASGAGKWAVSIFAD
jgi:hypothetical protein